MIIGLLRKKAQNAQAVIGKYIYADKEPETMTETSDNSDDAEPAVFKIKQRVYGKKNKTTEYTEHDAKITYTDGSVQSFTFDKVSRGSKGITFYEYMETREGDMKKRAFKFVPHANMFSFDTTERRAESVIIGEEHDFFGWFAPSDVEKLRESEYGDYDEIVVGKENRSPI